MTITTNSSGLTADKARLQDMPLPRYFVTDENRDEHMPAWVTWAYPWEPDGAGGTMFREVGQGQNPFTLSIAQWKAPDGTVTSEVALPHIEGWEWLSTEDPKDVAQEMLDLGDSLRRLAHTYIDAMGVRL